LGHLKEKGKMEEQGRQYTRLVLKKHCACASFLPKETGGLEQGGVRESRTRERGGGSKPPDSVILVLYKIISPRQCTVEERGDVDNLRARRARRKKRWGRGLITSIPTMKKGIY